MTAAPPLERPVGALLRQWRERRRLSQLELSNQAEVSTRHLSFVETSRAQPSREMILHLSEHLGVPLRARNELLLAAGFAPVYAESALDAPRMTAVHGAVRQILTAHEPYPAVVVDRGWNLVDLNDTCSVFTDGVAPSLLAAPANALRLALHPEGMAPRILNLGEWRAHLLARLRGQIARTADPRLTQLLRELTRYPCDQPEPVVDIPGPGDIVVPLRIAYSGHELTFFGVVATFGTPLDVTVAELAIESFFPADPTTADYLRQRPSTSETASP